MKAYYNEHDPKAAAWLRELIKQGHIADGDVDERSIEDVVPNELAGYTQCHFFAGIGVWSYSLRRAGWPDDRPVWTGSCPCQPFSAAGKAGGFDDERHLWPAFFHLVQQCRPATIFGEQVASKDGLAWLQLVHLDLEGTGYSVGALDLCAAGFGAPHIRQRLFFVANSSHTGSPRTRRVAQHESTEQQLGNCVGKESSPLGDTKPTRLEGYGGDVGNGNQPGRHGAHAAGSATTSSAVESLAYASGERERANQPGRDSGNGFVVARAEPGRNGGDNGPDGNVAHPMHAGRPERWPESGSGSAAGGDGVDKLGNSGRGGREELRGNGIERSQDVTGRRDPSPTAGFWHPADWLPCRDGKWRPVEPGTFPLAHGAPARVGRLRGYGNAIVAPVAQGFIEAYLGVTS